jgi:hypothetical protein
MCSCGMVRDGAFVLVAAIWLAINSSVFLGAGFGTLLMQALHRPDNVPNSLIIFGIVLLIGCIRFAIGVNHAMVDGDTASIPASLIGMGASGLALYKGFLPAAYDVGLTYHLAWQGFYVAFFGAALGNLWLAMSARQRRRRLLEPLVPPVRPQFEASGSGFAAPAAGWSFEPVLAVDNASFHRLLAQLRAMAPAERLQLFEELAPASTIPARPFAMAWPSARDDYS